MSDNSKKEDEASDGLHLWDWLSETIKNVFDERNRQRGRPMAEGSYHGIHDSLLSQTRYKPPLLSTQFYVLMTCPHFKFLTPSPIVDINVNDICSGQSLLLWSARLFVPLQINWAQTFHSSLASSHPLSEERRLISAVYSIKVLVV